jgi:hypothetical protein
MGFDPHDNGTSAAITAAMLTAVYVTIGATMVAAAVMTLLSL